MFHNLDQLRLQLERENLHGVNAKTCLQALRTQFKEFLASKGENGSQLHDEILHEHQIKSSVKMQSQDIQINPVQAMDDSLIVSKSSLIEPENNNAFSKSEIETQMQRQEEKVNMREAVDAGGVFGLVNERKGPFAEIRWQKRIFCTLILQDEMNDPYCFRTDYRLKGKPSLRSTEVAEKNLSSTFSVDISEHKLR
ncbi:hypothetical protein Tco_1556480 [Tanacetum coccineum]